jgi:hypothetical protein
MNHECTNWALKRSDWQEYGAKGYFQIGIKPINKVRNWFQFTGLAVDCWRRYSKIKPAVKYRRIRAEAK